MTAARLGAALLAAVALAAPAGPATAQRIGTDVFGYLGFSRANFTSVGGADLGQRWVNGATGGVGLRHPLSGPAGLRGELLLARRGGGFTVPVEGEELALTLDLVYLEVPVQLQFQSYQRREETGSRFRPFAFAGVVPSFKLGCDAEGRLPSAGVAQRPCTEVLAEEIDWFEVGGAAGVGVEFRKRRTILQLQARYFQSFSDLGPGLEVANRTFAILLGVGM